MPARAHAGELLVAVDEATGAVLGSVLLDPVPGVDLLALRLEVPVVAGAAIGT